MLLKPLTHVGLVKTFNTVLKAITDGKLLGCPSDTGLDFQTFQILNQLARQPGKKRAADILACRIEFGRMLDGTHAREDEAVERALFA